MQTYAADIEAGKTKTRETADGSLKKFLSTKKAIHQIIQTLVFGIYGSIQDLFLCHLKIVPFYFILTS